MPDPPELETLYQEWLEIPAHRLPPNHYALLGLNDFESDEETITSAAKARSAYLHQIASGPQRRIVQELLGQVAIAKRTLLDTDSRATYDEAISAEASAAVAAEFQHENAEEDQQPIGPQEASTSSSFPSEGRNRKSLATEWKYHAISASVLLAIVAAVYWFNRDGGGRRAAEARPSEPSPVAESSSSKQQKSNSPRSADVAPQTTRTVNPRSSSSPTSRSPIAKKRDTGSGLGSGLGDKFSDILSDIASQSDPQQRTNKKPDGDAKEFRPLGSYQFGKIKKRVNKEDLPKGLRKVTQFPDALADRFDVSVDAEWYEVRKEQLVVKVDSSENQITITDKEAKLTPGSAISMKTSLGRKMNAKSHAGFVAGAVRLGIRPTNNGIEVFARDIEVDSKIESISKIKSGAKQSRLWIVRSEDQPDRVDWFVQTGSAIQSGTLMVTSLAEAPAVGVFVSTPTAESKAPFWISDLTLRSGDGP